jgi:hypothetical protein
MLTARGGGKLFGGKSIKSELKKEIKNEDGKAINDNLK